VAVTLSDIAEAVGVRKSTVSIVLNNRPNRVKISDRTRRRIFEAAERLGYQPNAAAKALSTKRTGHVGFILSDRVTDGLVNLYYGAIFRGIEHACRQRGYGLNVSLYNLSSVDSFIIPPKVGQRAVDGLILTGYVEAAVVARFREFDIPCVCIGDNVEVAELVPTIACDVVDGLCQAVRHAAELGHRRAILCHEPTRRSREVADLVVQRCAGDPVASRCRLDILEPSAGRCDYDAAACVLEHWLAAPPEERATVIFASDQTQVAMLGLLGARGLMCPRDVSLISSGDTRLSEFANPPLTAVHTDLEQLGRVALDMLVDHLEGGGDLTPRMSKNDYPCRLIVRSSCASHSR